MIVESTIKSSVRRFGDAVSALAEPRLFWDSGVCRRSPDLYSALRGVIGGRVTGVRGTRMSTSRPPLDVRVLDLLAEVDATVRGWLPEGPGTVGRLRQLAAQTWGPDSAGLLDERADALLGWAESAADLLGLATPKVHLPFACPACSAAWFYRLHAGERVRSRPLVVGDGGAACQACGAAWPVEHFGLLAQLLGCTPAAV